MVVKPFVLDGMFGQSQPRLVAGLMQVGDRLCQHGGGDWPRRCDCKFGASGQGEESGCPEIVAATALIHAMTRAEYRRLCKRAGVLTGLEK